MCNIELINTINEELGECTEHYELMNYFRKKPQNDIYRILFNVCSYELGHSPNNIANTLTKSFFSNDFSCEDIIWLDENVKYINNKYLKAKVFHVLFLFKKRKDKNDLIQSMKYYSKSIDNLSTKDSIYIIKKILFIIIYLGNITKNFTEEYNLAKTKSAEFLENLVKESPIAAINFLDLVIKLSIKNDLYIIEYANKIADQLILEKQYEQAILALELSKHILHPSRNAEKLSKTNRKIADSYISRARMENGFSSAHFFLRAIETLSEIKNTREERLSLYEEMRDCQLESILDLKLVETPPFDVSPLLEGVNNILSDSKNSFDMLFRISCCILDIPSIKSFKDKEIKQGESITDILFGGREYIDHEGMNISVGEIPSILDFDDIPEEKRQLLWAKIVEQIKIHHQVSCITIQEAIRLLNISYTTQYNDILNLCRNNLFIPEGHEEFFAKGLYAGLSGDFLTASHLLTPQIENSLRYLLKLRAEEPTTLHPNNEQERDGLKSLLENPEIINILGIDGVLHLRTILIDKRYPALRHSIAHGFTDATYFYGNGAIYLWWLVLRIVMISFREYWERMHNE